MSIKLSDSDYLDLKSLVEETLDNVQSMSCLDESISNLEQIQEILERVNHSGSGIFNEKLISFRATAHKT